MEDGKIITALRKLHRDKTPLNITHIKRHHPALICAVYARRPFLGWRQALEMAGIGYNNIITELETHITCPWCQRDYQRLPAHLVTHGISSADFTECYPDRELLAEINRPIRKSGPPEMPHWESIWSREYILDRTWQWYLRLDRCNNDTILRLDSALCSAALDGVRGRWKRWEDVIRDLGLDPIAVGCLPPPRYPDGESVIAGIQARHNAGISLSAGVVQFEDYPLNSAAADFFGGWQNAISAAGLDPIGVGCRPPARYPTKASIIKEIKARYAAGRSLSCLIVQQEDPPLSLTTWRLWGGWKLAIHAAGLTAEHKVELKRNYLAGGKGLGPLQYPDFDSVKVALNNYHGTGNSLVYREISAQNPDLARCVHNVLDKELRGRWKQCMIAFGLGEAHAADCARNYLDHLQRTKATSAYPTPESVIQGLRILHGKGYITSTTARKHKKSSSLHTACLRHFGSWIAAHKSASISIPSLFPRPRDTSGRPPSAQPLLRPRLPEGK
jgi:hypothetical protein